MIQPTSQITRSINLSNCCPKIFPRASDNMDAYATHKRNNLVLLSTNRRIVIPEWADFSPPHSILIYLFFFLATSIVVVPAFEFAVAETFGLIFFGFLTSLLPRFLPLAIRFPFWKCNRPLNEEYQIFSLQVFHWTRIIAHPVALILDVGCRHDCLVQHPSLLQSNQGLLSTLPYPEHTHKKLQIETFRLVSKAQKKDILLWCNTL